MKRFAPSKCLLVTSGWILALCLTPNALNAAPLEVTKVTTLEPVVRSESTPQSSVPGVLKATVAVAPILHSTRQTPATVQLRANCEGDGDGVPISISGSSLALTLPTAPNAQPSYTVTLKWDGTYQGTVMPVQGYACTLEAVLSRGTSATLPELVSPPFEVAESWMLKSYSDAEGVSVTSSSNGNVTVNATATLTSDPDGSTSTSPVQLTVSKSAVLDSPEVPTQDNKLVVALELLTPGNVPVGTEPLIGLGQVVRMLPADTQVVSGSVELRLPYDSAHFDPITLSPARFDSMLGEWLTCDIDPACGGFSIDTTAKVLKVQTKEFSDWTTVDQNTVIWRVSFTSTSGATEVQIATGRSNTIDARLTVSELDSEWDEDPTPITDELESAYVRWVTSTSSYPASTSAYVGTVGASGSCANYPSNCPYVLGGVNQAVGTYYLQAVLDLDYDAYQLGNSTWSDTQCPTSQPSGEALRKIYHCLKVRSVQLITWYRDSDGDKYGNPAISVEQETQPSGYVSDSTDCDDTRSTVHPTADEIVGNEIDENCKDGEICYTDADGDGYRSNTNFTVSSDADCQDGAEASVTEPSENCDDNKNSNPGKTEVCDTSNADEDCDGTADDSDSSASDKTVWYYDADNDTYGLTSSSQTRCDANGTYRAMKSGDCNDGSASTFPGAAEKESTSSCRTDADNDGYGSAAPVTGATAGGDCNDSSAATFPGSAEKESTTSCRTDGDSDGYGSKTPATGGTAGTDCNDGSNVIYPRASDPANDGVDHDCGGSEDQDITVATSGGHFTSLKSAVNAAQEGARITVGSGTFYDYGIDLGTKNLTITGQGETKTYIDGQLLGQIFSIGGGQTSATVLSRFTARNGKSSYGGCIAIRSSGPQLLDITFTGCESTADGGALYAYTDTTYFYKVKFIDNLSHEDGGALQLDFSTAVYDHCIFEGNRSDDPDSGEGGAVFTWSGRPVFKNSLFRANQMPGRPGGALEIFYSDAEIYNTAIVGNSGSDGGGINFYGGGEAILSNVLIANNYASDVGGGISIENYPFLQMDHVVVVDNDEAGGKSGGLYELGTGDLIITNSIFSHNHGSEMQLNGATHNITYSIVAGGTTGTTLGTGCSTADPGFNLMTQDYLTNDDYHLMTTSIGVNKGTGAKDPDNSTADIGIFGGPYGNDWDLDGDGLETYWWAGSISNVPSGYSSAGFETSFIP